MWTDVSDLWIYRLYQNLILQFNFADGFQKREVG